MNGWTGIIRKDWSGSMEKEHDFLGKVTTWKMSPEELAAYREKYPPKMPLSGQKRRYWKRISKEIYMKFRRQGLTDGQILNKFPGLNMGHLVACKERWEID